MRERDDIFQVPTFFALRTPLLPARYLSDWSDGLRAPFATHSDQLPEALAADRLKVRLSIRKMLKRPEVTEALFVASPSLVESLAAWQTDPESERGQRVEGPLVRYLERMMARPTPFGLFAACSIGAVGDATRLKLTPLSECRRHSRLDMHYLCALAETLAEEPSLQDELRYVPNSTLYWLGGQPRYVEARTQGPFRERTHELVSLAGTEYLAATLERASGGATVRDLVQPLVRGLITAADARAYVDALISGRALVSELEPPVTGDEPLEVLIQTLRRYPSAASWAGCLEQVQRDLEDLDRQGPGVAVEHYLSIARRLEELPAEVELPRLFQVDLTRPAPQACMGEALLEDLKRGLHVLHQFSAAPVGSDPLARFREAFEERYEGREVPLVEALDHELGIGFGDRLSLSEETSPLLEDLDFSDSSAEASASFGAREAFLLRKLDVVLRSGSRELELAEEDAVQLRSGDSLPLPDALAIIATVSKNGDLWIRAATGPSGVLLLGRFCSGNAEMLAHVQQHLRAEESLAPEAVFAEIVHLPQGRSGNVLRRPQLRAHEIPYLGRSGAPADAQISVRDLWISLRDKRMVLRSARLGKEVIPRLTTAHNFIDADVGIYRFLSALQNQSAMGINWSWGALTQAAFLPRVRVGKFVLALARWRLEPAELKEVKRLRGAERYLRMQQLRTQRRLPRHVVFAEDDHHLPVDLDNSLSVDAFVQAASAERETLVLEAFPDADQLCVEAPEGALAHEIVLPLVRRRRSMPPATLPAPDGAAVTRAFHPGEECLYAKLYTGPATADRVLLDVVRPVIQEYEESGELSRWFFIRYADPDFHLRLRFFGSPRWLSGTLWPRLLVGLRAFREGKAVSCIQLESYQREVDRYGGPRGIELAERLFWADSSAVLSCLGSPAAEDEDLRWRLALAGIHRLLGDLGFVGSARNELLRGVRDAFAAELGLDAKTRRKLDAKYRSVRQSLEPLVDRSLPSDPDLAPALEAWAQRSSRLASVVASLRSESAAGRLSVSLGELARSFVHMHVNRVLRSGTRPQELILYDFLERLGASQEAREERKKRSLAE